MQTTFYVNNRKSLIEKLPESSMVILFAGTAPHENSDRYYAFSVNNNFRYMTGLTREGVIFVIVKRDGMISERIYIDPVNELFQKVNGRQLTVECVTGINGIKDVRENTGFLRDIHAELNRYGVQNLWLDLFRNGFGDEMSKAQYFAESIKQKYPSVHIQNVSRKIAELRRIKSPEEIEKIKEAIEITDEGIDSMMSHSVPGMYEYEYEAYYNFCLKRKNAGFGCFTTLASGESSVILHYPDNNRQTRDGGLMLCDLGASVEGYGADISRTFPVNGTFTPRQAQIYQIVLDANKYAISLAKPGITMREIDNLVIDFYAERLKEINLIQSKEEVSQYYYHFISHYLGLDTHDVGDNSIPLEPGVVLTIEPGLYLEKEGIGIRIEDDVLITEEGCVILTKNVKKELKDIEDFMKNSRILESKEKR